MLMENVDLVSIYLNIKYRAKVYRIVFCHVHRFFKTSPFPLFVFTFLFYGILQFTGWGS
jgi:hypothetical protein